MGYLPQRHILLPSVNSSQFIFDAMMITVSRILLIINVFMSERWTICDIIIHPKIKEYIPLTSPFMLYMYVHVATICYSDLC